MAEGEEERVVIEGAVNPAFREDLEVQSEMRGGMHDSTLAARRQRMQARTAARGNEGAQNYFDPSVAAEGDPRQCRMSEVGARDELELKFMNADERNLYEKLSEMLQQEDTSTIIDLPGTVMSDRGVEDAAPVAEGGWIDRQRDEQLGRREDTISQYVEQLDERVQKHMIPLGRPALGQEELLERGMTEEKVWARKKKVMSLIKGNSKIRHKDEEEAVLRDRLYAVFQRAENRLLNSLRQRQAEVIDQYGEIVEETGNTEALSIGPDLHWQVEWTHTPQPIEVQVLCLRAVREKLPSGLYSVSMSLHTQLGGHTLRWSRLQEQRWAANTDPVQHHGRYRDTELNINQSLYMVLPASCDLLPSSVLVFRLLSLPGDHSYVSSVVSWGAFPICDCSLKLLKGKFKTPLLRGGPNASVNQFRKIEHLLSTDLDNWLCNIYFQVKRLPRGSTRVPEHSFPLQIPSHPRQSFNQGPPLHPNTSSRSSASLPGKSPTGAVLHPEPIVQTNPPSADKNKATFHTSKSDRQQKIITRNSETLRSLTKDQLEQFTFSLRSQHHSQHCSAPMCCGTADRMRLAVRLLQSLLDLSLRPCHRLSQISLNVLLFTLMWFPRLYLHYCSQWIYLQSKHIPINRFGLCAHTVVLVYQGSLLSSLEEVMLVLLGPVTLSAATLLLLAIRWGCQRAFGSTPSFLSKFITAAALWTVLHPLALFTVDAVLGRLSYSAEEPLADAAKLYWHFYRTEQSGTAGIIITLFLYAVHFILSLTVFYVYLLRLHNDGRLLDIYQRLHCAEGAFFIPHDMEVSNQELNYIVKMAEQWRGFNGERRKDDCFENKSQYDAGFARKLLLKDKSVPTILGTTTTQTVAVHDYIWTEEEPVPGLAPPAGTSINGCETSTHLSIYTLHLSGLRQHYRHFLRQPDGAIIEVMEDIDSAEFHRAYEHEKMKCMTHLRERKRRKPAWRSHRVEPVGGSVYDSITAVKESK
ncbi:uncharacterized protein ofcc1 [Xyrauchen texanus]|uniref:uncharacterized protein ofcc1 n=1 Tax=Xyrauchen texanus TaxID=154827 RepID=UPI002241896F|nr:uncharacterized protein ofcc1 [Xyrauchen texanus]